MMKLEIRDTGDFRLVAECRAGPPDRPMREGDTGDDRRLREMAGEIRQVGRNAELIATQGAIAAAVQFDRFDRLSVGHGIRR